MLNLPFYSRTFLHISGCFPAMFSNSSPFLEIPCIPSSLLMPWLCSLNNVEGKEVKRIAISACFAPYPKGLTKLIQQTFTENRYKQITWFYLNVVISLNHSCVLTANTKYIILIFLPSGYPLPLKWMESLTESLHLHQKKSNIIAMLELGWFDDLQDYSTCACLHLCLDPSYRYMG